MDALAFTVFWAYIGFSQYMLIWYANIPEETEWFIRRNTESWNALNLFLVIGRFFVPFALLLLRAPKKSPRKLCLIAGWIIFMQLVDIYIVVLPMLSSGRPAPQHLGFPASRRDGGDARPFSTSALFHGRRSFRIAIPVFWSLCAPLIDRDATTNHRKKFGQPSMFSTWIGMVLLFAFFGLLVLVILRRLAARRQL